MKNSDEMVKSLFERREQYMAEQKRKKKIVLITITSLCCMCFAAVLGIRIFQVRNNTVPQINTLPTETPQEKIQISLFDITPQEPTKDSFGIDELRHIDVILNGSKVYSQLEESDYTKYGIKSYLEESDFGDKIGTITETDNLSKALNTPCSQEPTLVGCEVFLYAPANCEALLIVKGRNNCSLFLFSCFSEQGHGYHEEYAIFNVVSSKDVARIDYCISKPDGGMFITTAEGSITDPSDLNAFINITKKLVPYVRESTLSGDPDWLNTAREEYNSNDENRISIEASVILKNGLSMPFSYEPNLGTGYVTGHYFLSEEDNAIMRKIFQE